MFVVLLVIAPSSQELGPPTNPARFKTTVEGGEDLATIVATLRAELESERNEKEKVKNKNKELISEKQVAKQAADAAEMDAAEKSGDIEALKSAHAKEVKKLQDKLDAADSDLRTIRVDSEIAKALTEGNVRPEMADALTALMKSKHTYENGEATIDGKSIGEAIGSYLGSAAGAFFRRPAESGGADASGNVSTSAPAKLTKRPDTQQEWDALDAMTDAQRNAFADSINAPDLKV